MMTELVPSARATMLSMNVTGHAVGRALSILAAFIYQQFGFTFVALTAVIFNGRDFWLCEECKKMTIIIFFGGCRKFLPAAYDQSLKKNKAVS